MKDLTPFKAVSDAVLAVAAERSVEEVLQRLVRQRARAGRTRATRRSGCRTARAGSAQFLDLGHDRRARSPRSGRCRASTACSARCSRRPSRSARADIHDHPRFRGWWPRGHPDMRSFLGVPIVAPEGVIGAFYLTEKDGRRRLRRRGPGADRAAGGARGDRDHQRAPVRAQPRAVDAGRAQPARARAARRGQPEAVQPGADRRGRGRRCSTGATPPRRATRSAQAAGARRARRSTSCAR